jgi:dihydrolipoamide dehydrogenase
MHTQLVVLGGGPGGYAAAFMAADLGMEVTIVEADPRLGGTCLLRGCIPSKALLHVARVLSEVHEVAEWGVTIGDVKINVDSMRARKDQIISMLSGGLKELAKRRKVKVIHARGIFVDSQTLQLEGGDPATYDNARLTFDHCILATGSKPAVPKAFDLPTDRVMDSTGALDLIDIPKTLLVVGGGYIGLEMGTVYANIGSQVTVVELTDGLLPGADRDLVRPLAKKLEKVMHRILLNTKVAALKDAGDHIDVTLEGSEKTETLPFDRVLVSIGRRPITAGIGLENTKVKLNERGFVIVDNEQRTNDPHILAIGDVAGEPMLAHKAAHEGKVAAEVLHGEPAQFEPQAIPAVVFTDPEIAWAGLTEEQAKREGREVTVAQYPWQASGRAVAVGVSNGMTKWLVDPATERLLGCGIVGTGAGELIAEAVLAIEMGCTARDLAETIHPHPTLSETVGFSAEVFLGNATEVYRPKRAANAK